MNLAFFAAGAVAVIATLMVITRLNAMHALLYLIVSLLAVALVFYTLGAPFVAALEVIIYAGAIMVLFVFVIMVLNLGPQSTDQEKEWLQPGMWLGPALLAGALLVELILVLLGGQAQDAAGAIGPKEVGMALYGPYLLGVELASMLLLAGLIGAYHLGRSPERGEMEIG